ncbi:MAG: hypothetical protein K6G83_15645 [Lachnospiraceae bacterium]|nr:hypothetical protein [Lachnospiraceae bacterium]
MIDEKNVVTEKDILSECCGLDGEGFPKAAIMVRLSFIKAEKGEEEAIYDEILMDEPAVQIFRSPALTMVDLVFSPESFQLANCFARMQEFIHIQAGEEEKNDDILPTIFLTISPRQYMDRFFCTGMHGAYYLMPSKAGYKPDTIRFIFNSAMFGTYVTEEGRETR